MTENESDMIFRANSESTPEISITKNIPTFNIYRNIYDAFLQLYSFYFVIMIHISIYAV